MGFPRRDFRPGDQRRPHRRPGGPGRPEAGGPQPRPIGNKCNQLCPYFRCNQRALVIRNEFSRGKQIKVTYCRWIGDNCIGAGCQYAYCALKALLPDGKCMYAVKKEQERRAMRDMFEELKESDIDYKTKSLITRRFGKYDDVI